MKPLYLYDQRDPFDQPHQVLIGAGTAQHVALGGFVDFRIDEAQRLAGEWKPKTEP